MQEHDFYTKYHYQLVIDNQRIIYTENLRPEVFYDVQVYFGDKYYPAANAFVKNFYACQGNEMKSQHSFSYSKLTKN